MVFLSRKVPLHCNSYIEVLLPRSGRNHPGLGYSHFARHYSGNHSCFLLLRLLRCFSSARSLPPFGSCHTFNVTGCPIRISSDRRLFAPPQSFSQLITSFFASESLGIHRMPLLTFLLFLSLVNHLSSNMSKNFIIQWMI
jgi:hypothetical protein